MKRNIGAELTARMTHVNEMLANGESVEAISRADVDRPQPAAWLAFATDGSESSAVYMMQEQAQAAADEWGWGIAPLYSTPGPHATPGECTSQGGCTLTDAERFVLREVRDIYANEDDVKCNEIAAVIDGLLERTKRSER